MSTVDRQEFKEISFGPNFAYRDKFFELVSSNRDVFRHKHLEEMSRKKQRHSLAKEILFYSKNQLISY
jgi:hypothetical protein